MKMANMDAAFDFMFTNPKDDRGVSITSSVPQSFSFRILQQIDKRGPGNSDAQMVEHHPNAFCYIQETPITPSLFHELYILYNCREMWLGLMNSCTLLICVLALEDSQNMCCGVKVGKRKDLDSL